MARVGQQPGIVYRPKTMDAHTISAARERETWFIPGCGWSADRLGGEEKGGREGEGRGWTAMVWRGEEGITTGSAWLDHESQEPRCRDRCLAATWVWYLLYSAAWV